MLSNGAAHGRPVKRARTANNPDPGHYDDDDSNSVEGGEDRPACQSCRKRKAKCSKEQPCSHCHRLDVDCVYDDRKSRPGMRTGAVEALNKRLSLLEQMFLGQGLLLKPLLDQQHYDFARPGNIATNSDAGSLEAHAGIIKRQYLAASDSAAKEDPPATLDLGPENRATHELQYGTDGLSGSSITNPLLPPDEIVQGLIEWYFRNVHPWIPILHERRFKAMLQDRRQEVIIILYAMVSTCLKFLPTSTINQVEQKRISFNCRNAVIIQSMERISIASLQALVIVSFDIVGSGRGPSAWSIIGSMARTAEQLSLSLEDSGSVSGPESREYIFRRISFVQKSENWIELEERRRLYWSVFMMDRFCSVATGWNNSLTRADGQRRLPCEGALWEAGTPVKTPFFGIAERALPTDISSNSTSERDPSDEDVEHMGGFAFCIEATESLNLVTSFFLRQAINFKDVQDIQLWLMRFKELDLRLVKWRLFLPPRWKNASVLNQDGIMDPNLTLAHITHNTAVVQLHQCVAYPSMQWRVCPISLPSASSAETCVAAACEISTIAEESLQFSTRIASPQFSFCLFIAGRVLLAHASYNNTPINASFDAIAASLSELARRWSSPHKNHSTTTETSAPRPLVEENLASKLSKRLDDARRQAGSWPLYLQDASLGINQSVYSDQMDAGQTEDAAQSTDSNHNTKSVGRIGLESEHSHRLVDSTGDFSPNSITLAFPPLPMSFEQNQDVSRTRSSNPSNQRLDMAYADGLVEVNNENNQILFDADFDSIFDGQYKHMLRVSTFTDGKENHGG